MEKLIEKFQAKDDDGNLYTVHVYQYLIESQLINRPSGPVGGTKREALSDGTPLEWIDDDTFRIGSTGKIIRRVY
jgi:hypothetical protein